MKESLAYKSVKNVILIVIIGTLSFSVFRDTDKCTEITIDTRGDDSVT